MKKKLAAREGTFLHGKRTHPELAAFRTTTAAISATQSLLATIVIIAAFSIGSFPVQADLTEKALKALCHEPCRSFHGEVIDLSPRFIYERETEEFGWCKSFTSKPCPAWQILRGNVFQVLEHGSILLKRTDSQDHEIVLVRHLGTEGVADDDGFIIFAHPDGTASYTTVLGARKTILAFDYGDRCTTEQQRQLQKEAAAKRQALRQALQQQNLTREKVLAAKAAQARAARMKAYEAEAKAGHAYAMVELAKLYASSDPPDLERARHWLSLAALAGNAEATNLLQNLRTEVPGTTLPIAK